MSGDYSRKIKLCEILGANKFQKFVFKVERCKYRMLKRICPDFLNYYDKFNDYRRKKELKKVHSNITRKKIIEKYRIHKILVHKEFNREKNINYHMDENRPSEFIRYLDWNKNIHKRGLVKNLILISGLGVLAAFGFVFAIPLISMELISALINFQCVNIQNYNIYRYKKNETLLKRVEECRTRKNINNYSEAANVIVRSLNETEEVPSVDDIINNIQSKKQLQQLRNMAISTLTASKTYKNSSMNNLQKKYR